MSVPAPAAPVPPAPPNGGPTREVRLAVVMYGGVSLAIYINGVAQELLRLVRATAPGDTPESLRFSEAELSPIERVYRRLARLVDSERTNGTRAGDAAPVRARFTVDILSGTSAGGINAIFLAKALANGDTIDRLQELWLAEADLKELINDGRSTRGLGLPRVESPESLLNSRRMYLKLLDAFDGMDVAPGGGSAAGRPLVPQVDLFVTSTDIEGVVVPLRLSDRTVTERRHRSVFHFARDGGSRNDFGADFNPLLAFSARATSAFPFAFEPMRLCDIDGVLDLHPRYAARHDCRSGSERWQPFFADFAGSASVATTPVPQRSFGDGGYLDNKPFSYATETLLQREATLPVDRKLIYVEPAPEHPELAGPKPRPDVIENVLAATVGLPRYETIREDLERVIARNRLTERVRSITEGIDLDVHTAGQERMPLENPGVWANRDLAVMVKQKGAGYGGYHRLRVAVATDMLAGIIARAGGFNEASAHHQAWRYVVRAWRDDRFQPYTPSGGVARQLENRFLLDFDLEFRVRRLAHVLARADVLYAYDFRARDLARLAAGEEVPGAELAAFRAELLAAKGELLPGYRAILDEMAALRAGREQTLKTLVSSAGITEAELLAVLDPDGDPQRENAARDLVAPGQRRQALESAITFVRARMAAVRTPSSLRAPRVLDPTHLPADAPVGRRLARAALWHFYRYFDDYDMVAFPILYSTEAGEQDTVEVVRISPEDAKSLVGRDGNDRRRKLAGTVLFNFGAFLDRVWRANDLLWGRLDAAERVICSMLPDPRDREIRDELVEQANRAILEEYLRPASRTEVSRLVVASLVSATSGEPTEPAVRALVRRLKDAPLEARFSGVLHACLNEDEVLAHFRQDYEVNREVDRPQALRTLARSARVVGRMLEGITARRLHEAPKTAWLTRAAGVFWGLVEIAVPGGFPSLVWRHWLSVLVAFEIVLTLLGVLIDRDVAWFGVRALAVTGLAAFAVWVVRDYILRRATVRKVLGAVAMLAVAAFAAIGAARVFGIYVPDVRLAEVGRVAPRLRDVAAGLAALLGAGIVLGGGIPLLVRRGPALPGGFRLPAIAAELPASGADLEALAADDGRRRAIVRGLVPDYVFIAAYWLLFILAGVMLAGAGGVVMLALGGVCALAGTAAAVCDVAENVQIQQALGRPRAMLTDWTAGGIRAAALAKWTLVFVAVAAGAALFYVPGDLPMLATGGVWIAAALLGLAGLARRRTLVQYAFLLLGIGLVAMAVLFFARRTGDADGPPRGEPEVIQVMRA